MLYPIEDSELWAQRYNLKIEKSFCLKCKKEITINIPFASKNIRGFKSEDHGCPSEYTQYYFTSLHPNNLIEAIYT